MKKRLLKFLAATFVALSDGKNITDATASQLELQLQAVERGIEKLTIDIQITEDEVEAIRDRYYDTLYILEQHREGLENERVRATVLRNSLESIAII